MKHYEILLPALFCAVCCVMPLGLYAMTYNPEPLPDVPAAESAVTVPEVLYLSHEEAVRQLSELGLRVIETEKIHHPVIPENAVLTQNPSAGAAVREGDAVTLTLSSGWTEYLPDVRDIPKDKAAEKLEALGFSVSFQESSSETVAPGAVLTQSIPPDTRIALGSSVTLTISTGREHTDTSVTETVGNYIGMNFEDAKAQLADANLYAVQADTVYRPEIANGTVISQNIPSGSSVPQGTAVELKISLGQITAHVPDCTGKSAAEARQLLETAGFVCMITYTPSGTIPLDTIMSQNQPADSSVPQGSQIWLTASAGDSSYVISTGGWSGNPLPSFNTEPETEPPPEEFFPDAELQDPPEDQLPEEEPAPEFSPEYFDAPETAPF